MVDFTTADKVKQAIARHSIVRWPQRDCSICGYELSYNFTGGLVYFDPGCNCSPQGPAPFDMRDYADIAKCFNIQSTPEIAQRMWDEFIACGTDVPDDLPAQDALAQAWAEIDGKTEQYESDPDTKDGYMSDAESMISGLKKRGFKLQPFIESLE